MTAQPGIVPRWMKAIAAAFGRQVVGDRGIALTTLVSVAALWVLSRAWPLADGWLTSLLVAGIIAILCENVLRSVR